MLRNPDQKRQRAPSQRALQTRARILDAAETVFSEHGFDGASIRDIAAEAGVPSALVSHHGTSKEALFHTVIARRAEPLAQMRRDALAARKAAGPPDLRAVLACFVAPLLDRVFHGGAHWRAYGRLIALVSADTRFRAVAATWFDPTVEVFLDELQALLPRAPRADIAACFVFTVSAMLSVCTSRARIETLAQGAQEQGAPEHGAAPDATDAARVTQTLLDFCEAGFGALKGAA